MRHICFPMLLYLVPPDHMFQRCCLQFVIWERNLFHIVIATLFCIIATLNQFEHHQWGSKKREKEKEENSQEKISFWSFLWVKCLGFRRRLKSEPFRKIKSDCCTFDLNQKEAKKAGTTNIIEKVCWVRYYWYWMRARYSATVWERPAESYATWYRATCYVIRATVQRTR